MPKSRLSAVRLSTTRRPSLRRPSSRGSARRATSSRRANVEALQNKLRELEKGERKFRGVAVQALLGLLQRLEAGEEKGDMELYSFKELYRVRDMGNAFVARGSTVLLKKRVGLTDKVQVFAPGLGEFVVEANRLEFKERSKWTVEDVGDFVFRYADEDALVAPFSFDESAMGELYEGAFVCYVKNSNFHDLVVALVDHFRSTGRNPLKTYVYLESLGPKPRPPGSRPRLSAAPADLKPVRKSVLRRSNHRSGARSSGLGSSRRGRRSGRELRSSGGSGGSGRRRRPLPPSDDEDDEDDGEALATPTKPAAAAEGAPPKRTTVLDAKLDDAVRKFEEALLYVHSWDGRLEPLRDLQSMCEVFTMSQAAQGQMGYRFEVFCPSDEYRRFVTHLAQEYDTVLQHVLTMDLREAKPLHTDLDLAEVHAIVDHHIEGGWDAMETAVFTLLYRWVSANVSGMVAATREDKVPKGLGSRAVDLSDLLSIQGRLVDDSGQYVQAQSLLEEALERGHSDELKTARTMNDLGVVLAHRALYEAALDKMQRGLMTRRQKLGKDHCLVAQSMANVATVYCELGDFKDSQQLSLSALAIAKEHAKQEASGSSLVGMIVVARALNNLGNIAFSQGKLREAMERFESVREILVENLGRSHGSVADTLNSMANVFVRMHLPKKAFATAREALRVARQRDPHGEHPRFAQIATTVGRAQHEMGDLCNANKAFQRALTMWRSSLGKDVEHPLVTATHFEMATLLLAEGKHAQALEAHRKVLLHRLDRLPETHPLVADSYFEVGRALAAMRQYDDALESLRDATIIRKARFGPRHPFVGACTQEMAQCLHRKGWYDQAHVQYKVCLSVYQANKDVRAEAGTLGRVADLLLLQGKYDEALNAAEVAVRLYKAALGTTKDPLVADVLYTVAEVLRCKGRLPKATKRIEECLAIHRAFEKHSGPRLPVARALRRSAAILLDDGKQDAAMDRFSQAVAVLHEMPGEDAALSEEVETLMDWAKALAFGAGDLDAAGRKLQAALSIATDHGIPRNEVLHALGRLRAAQGRPSEALEFFGEALEALGNASDRPCREAVVLRFNMAKAHHQNGEFREASELFRQAGECGGDLWVADPNRSENADLLIDLLETYADACEDQLRLKTKQKVVEQLLKVKRRALGEKSPSVAATLLALADVLARRQRPDDAVVLVEEAAEIYAAAAPKDKVLRTECEAAMGLILAHQAKPFEAMRRLEDALAVQAKVLGKDNEQVAATIAAIARVLASLGKSDLALSKHLEARRIWLAFDPSAESVQNLYDAGALLLEQHDVLEAEAFFKEGVAALQRSMPPNHYLYAVGLCGLGRVAVAKGKLESATELFEEALDIHSKCGIYSVLYPQTLCDQARVLTIQGKYEGALALLREGLEIEEDRFAQHPHVCETYAQLGEVESHLELFDDAVESYGRALSANVTGPRPPLFAVRVGFQRAQALRAAMHYDQALDRLQETLQLTAGQESQEAQGLELWKLRIRHAMASVLLQLDRSEDAIAAWNMLLEDLQPIVEDGDPVVDYVLLYEQVEDALAAFEEPEGALDNDEYHEGEALGEPADEADLELEEVAATAEEEAAAAAAAAAAARRRASTARSTARSRAETGGEATEVSSAGVLDQDRSADGPADDEAAEGAENEAVTMQDSGSDNRKSARKSVRKSARRSTLFSLFSSGGKTE